MWMATCSIKYWKKKSAAQGSYKPLNGHCTENSSSNAAPPTLTDMAQGLRFPGGMDRWDGQLGWTVRMDRRGPLLRLHPRAHLQELADLVPHVARVDVPARAAQRGEDLRQQVRRRLHLRTHEGPHLHGEEVPGLSMVFSKHVQNIAQISQVCAQQIMAVEDFH